MDYDAITGMIFTIACGCVLPIYYIWQSTRRKISESKDRTQIVLAAIEKNKETDVEDLLKKMAPMQKKTLLKEKLLTKLLWGSIMLAIGIALLGFSAYMGYISDNWSNDCYLFSLIGSVLFVIGLAFIIYYFVGKKMLAKELEAEEKKLTAEANL